MRVTEAEKNESRQIYFDNQIQGTQQNTSSETPNRVFMLEMERIPKGPEYESTEAARQNSDERSASMEFLGHVPNFPLTAVQDGALTYMPLQNMQANDTPSCWSPYQQLYSANTVKSTASRTGKRPLYTHSLFQKCTDLSAARHAALRSCGDPSVKLKLEGAKDLLRRIPRRWQGTKSDSKCTSSNEQYLDRNLDSGTLECAADVCCSSPAHKPMRKQTNDVAVTTEKHHPSMTTNAKQIGSNESSSIKYDEVTQSPDAQASEGYRGFGDTMKGTSHFEDVQDLRNLNLQMDVSDYENDDEAPLAPMPVVIRAHAVPRIDLIGVQNTQQHLAGLHIRSRNRNTEQTTAERGTSFERHRYSKRGHVDAKLGGYDVDEIEMNQKMKETAANHIFQRARLSPSQGAPDGHVAGKDSMSRGRSGVESLATSTFRRKYMQENSQKVIQAPISVAPLPNEFQELKTRDKFIYVRYWHRSYIDYCRNQPSPQILLAMAKKVLATSGATARTISETCFRFRAMESTSR